MRKLAVHVTSVAVLVAVLAPAAAADTLTLTGRDEGRGEFTVELTVEGEGERKDVLERLRWASGGEELRRGQGTRQGDRLEARLLADVGAAGVVEGAAPLPEVLLVVTYFDRGEVEARATTPDGAVRVAKGGRPRGLDALRDLKDKGGKHLLALARKELEKRAADGVRIDRDLSLGSYLHLGVGGSVRWLRTETLTPDQAEALRKAEGRNAWLFSEVHGAPRVAYGVSVPVGEVTVGVGFDVGARVRYEVTDLYPLPESIRDGEAMAEGLRDLAVRTFDLPLDADEALALTPGARRALDGEAAVAVSGTLQVGREVTHFGDDIVRVGATARVGGWYRIAGNLRIEVTRLAGRSARVRVTRSDTVSRGASAELLLGAAIDEAKLRAKLAPATDYIDTAVVRDAAAGALTDAAAGQLRDALRFELRGSISGSVEDELDLAYIFDLSSDRARAAYGRAAKGDLRDAGALAGEAGSGVTLDHRVLGLESNTWSGADLTVSIILKAGMSKRVRFADIDVVDGDHVARYEVFSFGRTRHLEWIVGRRRGRSMSLDVVRRATPDGKLARSVRWTLDIEDPSTTAADAARFRRALAAWGIDSTGSGTDTPRTTLFRSAYGPTRAHLSVDIGEPGVAAILAVDEEAALQAYADAFAGLEGEVPAWGTPTGRRAVSSAFPNSDDEAMRRAQAELSTAERFAKGLAALGRSGTPEERAERLRKLASGARYDLYAITAMLALAPRDAVRLEASIAGDRLVTNGGHAGVDAVLVPVRDPR